MKHLKRFNESKEGLSGYISEFYIDKVSFGKRFINDRSGRLVVEINKNNNAFVNIKRILPYISSDYNEDKLELIMKKLLSDKFPNIEINYLNFE